MKIRCDFVTNSSTTAYCMIGSDDKKFVQKVLIALGIPFEVDDYSYLPHLDCWDTHAQGFCQGVAVHGDLWITEASGYVYEAGVPIENLLEEIGESATWYNLKVAVARKISEIIGEAVNPDQVKLIYGEAGN